MRVLLLITEDWYFWSHRLVLARALRDAGHEVTILTHVNEHADRILGEGFNLISWSLSRGSVNPWREVKALWEVFTAYRKYRPDLVHHVTLKGVTYGGLVAGILGIPSVNAVVGMGGMFHGRGAKKWVVSRIISRLLKKVLTAEKAFTLCQLSSARDELIARKLVDPDRAVVIRGAGVDLDRFKPTPEPEGTPIVMLAARMLWDKGVGEFVEAARNLRSRGFSARFVLVGRYDSENPARIQPSQIEQWVHEGVIEYWGHRDDMAGVLSLSTVFCLPSYHEGIPKVLLEACAAGRPSVVSDIPGCREVVRDGHNGIVVSVRSAEELEEGIARLLSSPELRHQMGVRARAIAENEFSDHSVVRQTFELYEAIRTATGVRSVDLLPES